MKRTPVSTSIFLCISAFFCLFCGKGGMDLTAQEVLWSRSDSSYNNFRIPSLIVTEKGTVLAFAEGREGGDSGDIDILLK